MNLTVVELTDSLADTQRNGLAAPKENETERARVQE